MLLPGIMDPLTERRLLVDLSVEEITDRDRFMLEVVGESKCMLLPLAPRRAHDDCPAHFLNWFAFISNLIKQEFDWVLWEIDD